MSDRSCRVTTSRGGGGVIYIIRTDTVLQGPGRDGSGMLEGREAQQLVDEVTQYMMNDLRHQGCAP